MVQWLALGIFTAMPWVQPLVRELRFCKMQGMIQKKEKKEKTYFKYYFII